MAGRSSDHDERVLRARMAAHLLHARVKDSAEHTTSARAAFLSRFEREVDQMESWSQLSVFGARNMPRKRTSSGSH